jgi:hypothetical protein
VADLLSDLPPDVPPDAAVRVYADRPYRQEMPRFYGSADGLPAGAVTTVAVASDGTVWAGTPVGLYRRLPTPADAAFTPFPAVQDESLAVDAIRVRADGTWVLASGGVYRVDGDALVPVPLPGRTATARVLADATGGALVLGNGFLCIAIPPANPGDPLSCKLLAVPPVGAPRAAAEVGDGLYLTADDTGSLSRFDGTAWAPVDRGTPAFLARSLAVTPAGDVLIATDRGLFRLEPGVAGTPTLALGPGALPEPSLTGIATASAGEDLLLSDQGLVARRADGGDYYHCRYWLPDDRVRDAARAPDGSLWVATAGGLGQIVGTDVTLEDKAIRYGEGTYARHPRLGYVSPVSLDVAGDLSTARTRDDDNDGQWTGMWLAALSYQYAVTKDPVIRARAKEASQALRLLQSVTYDQKFIARSLVPADECPARQAPGAGQWQVSADEKWCWKSDTSTDEFIGHLYGQSVYYDLAADDAEKVEVAAMVRRLVDHVIENGYAMTDVDGLPTTDGHMDPDFMAITGQFGDAGLNSAKLLGGLLAAAYMTGEQTYLTHYTTLIEEHGYGEYVRQEKQIQDVFWINHDSDEMAVMAFHVLLWHETDPARRAIWMEGFSFLWETQRPERNPEFNFTWAAHAGDGAEIDLDTSIRTLKDIPWDLVRWGCDNAFRSDVAPNPEPDRFGDAQALLPVAYDERHVMKWNSNPYGLTFGGTGNEEETATFWTLPYWMGRYGGYIMAPDPPAGRL